MPLPSKMILTNTMIVGHYQLNDLIKLYQPKTRICNQIFTSYSKIGISSILLVMDVLKEINESKSYDIKEMICDLSAVFKDIVIVESTSASPTVQVLAKIPDVPSSLSSSSGAYRILEEYMKVAQKDEVFVKIGFNAIDNADDIERTIYKYLLTLLKTNRTPNIIRYIMSFKCHNYYLKIQRSDKELDKKIFTKAEKIDRRIFNIRGTVGSLTGTTSFLVLERSKGIPLNELLESVESDFHLTNDDILAITFQIVYTLREMTLANVRQNDLHFGNIWIDILPFPEQFIYIPGPDLKPYVINTRYLVKIYDFDRGSFTIQGAPESERIKSLCHKTGQCSTPNEYFDLYTFCYKLNKRKHLYPYIETIVDAFIKDASLLDDSCCAVPGFLCPGSKEGCDSNYIPSGMRTFTDVLPSLFATFKKDRLEKVQFPTERILPKETLPSMVFSTNLYVSAYTNKTAIEVANLLLERS